MPQVGFGWTNAVALYLLQQVAMSNVPSEISGDKDAPASGGGLAAGSIVIIAVSVVVVVAIAMKVYVERRKKENSDRKGLLEYPARS